MFQLYRGGQFYWWRTWNKGDFDTMGLLLMLPKFYNQKQLFFAIYVCITNVDKVYLFLNIPIWAVHF